MYAVSRFWVLYFGVIGCGMFVLSLLASSYGDDRAILTLLAFGASSICGGTAWLLGLLAARERRRWAWLVAILFLGCLGALLFGACGLADEAV